jgi:hypothetical protein
LLEIWREVGGTSLVPEREFRAWLEHPQGQRVLAGRIPMWMAADPIYRLWLMRAGLLRPEETARERAIRERLGG